MSQQQLRRLAEDGLAALPPSELGPLAVWCWEWCEATGDGRYCILSRLLKGIDDSFGDADEDGGVTQDFADRIDAVLARELPGVLDAESAEIGTAVARTLRDDLAREFRAAGHPLHPRDP